MAIKVFDGTDNTFSTNGEIVLNPTRAIVHKEDNGSFYLDLETPLTQETKYVAPEEGSSATINGSGQIQNVDSTKESELVSLKGDTYQYTTQGKNLYNLSGGTNVNTTSIIANDTLKLTSNGTWARYEETINVVANQGYTFKVVFSNNTGKVKINLFDGNTDIGGPTSSTSSSGTFTIPFTPQNTTIKIQMYCNFTGDNVSTTTTFSQVQLEKGSATSYEPYTGGQASPSPTHQQSIDIVSGLQEVEIVGKNILPPFDSGQGSGLTFTTNSEGITTISGTSTSSLVYNKMLDIVLPQGTYTLSVNLSFTPVANSSQIILNGVNNRRIATINLWSSLSTTITLTEDTQLYRLYFYSNNNYTYNGTMSIQLEKGSATTYEPYKGKTYDINLGRNLSYFEHKEKNNIIFDGNEIKVQNPTNYAYIDYNWNMREKTEYSNNTYTIYTILNGTNSSNENMSMNLGKTGNSYAYQVKINANTTHNNEVKVGQVVLGQNEVFTNLNVYTPASATADFTIKIMIVKGAYTIDNIGEFVEYFTPIELCKIGTYQDKIFKGKGVNLFDKDDLLGGWVRATDGAVLEQYTDTYNYLPFLKVEPNTSYTIDLYSATGLGSGGICEYSSDNASSFIKGTAETQRVITFTTTPTTQYIRFCVRVDSKDKVMLLKGSITFSDLPTYEPYNAKDKWLLHKEIGKVVLNGSESNWQDRPSYNSCDRFVETTILNNQQTSQNTGLSNYFEVKSVSTTSYPYITPNGTQIVCNYSAKGTTTLAQFKTWLSTHNTIVYYVLSNPTTTEIDNSELVSELNNIELIGGINNISLSSGYLTGELELKYNFVSGGETTAKYIDYLQANNILVANTPQGNQAFRISNVERTRSKIRLKANHIFYDTQNYVISDSYVVEKNCNQALDHLNDATDNTSPFSMTSDITTLNSYRCVRKSLYEAIQVVLERWGGHLIRDNFDIKVMSSIGNDNGVVVRYGKNLKNISATYNWDAVATKLMPVGKDGLLLPEEYLYASVQYDIPYTKVISFDQNNIVEDDYADADAYQQALVDDLRQKGMEYLASNSIPMVNYTLNANLERITDIGDTIEVIDERLGINLLTNLISYEYNCILDKYTQVQFGNFTPKLQNLMETIASNTEKAIEENNGVIQITLENELTEATDRIWGVLGNSYVIYEGDKILVVDELPKENAHNVIMINSGGIGFSQTGINGTFQSAWTIDNTLNMENINVINLTADLIKGGILKLGSNLNQYGQIEIYNEANNLIAELNKNGFKMYGTDGSYVLMNTQVGFAGYDRNDNKIYWADGDAFHMKKSEVEEEITLCGKMRYIPIHLTDTYGVEHNGIGLVSVLGGGN